MTPRPARLDSPRPLSASAAAAWTVALVIVERFCVGATEAARNGAMTDIVSLSACEVLAASIIVFTFMRARAPQGSVRLFVGLRRVAPVHMFLAALAGAGLCPLLSSIDDRVLARWPYSDPEVVANIQKLVYGAPRVALVLGVFVVIPLCREVLFRGLFFKALRASASAWQAIALTAALSAAASLDWRTMPSVLLLSLALGWIRAQSGGIVASAVAHLSFWSVVAVPLLRGRDLAADVVYPPSWIIGGAAVALAALAASAFWRTAETKT